MGVVHGVGQASALIQQPTMPSPKVDMRHGIVGMARHFVRLMDYSAPKVGDEPVLVADDFERSRSWRGEQHRCRPAKRLDVLLRRPEPLPNIGHNFPFPTKVGKRRDKSIAHADNSARSAVRLAKSIPFGALWLARSIQSGERMVHSSPDTSGAVYLAIASAVIAPIIPQVSTIAAFA